MSMTSTSSHFQLALSVCVHRPRPYVGVRIENTGGDNLATFMSSQVPDLSYLLIEEVGGLCVGIPAKRQARAA